MIPGLLRPAGQDAYEVPGGGSLDRFAVWGGKQTGRGGQYDLIVVDEAAWLPALPLLMESALMPMLADRLGKLVMASVPWFANPGWRDVWKTCNLRVKGATWDLNPAPNIQGEIQRQRRVLNPQLFAQEWQAEFVDAIGSLLARESIRYHDLTLPDVCSGGFDLSLGVDLAISARATADETALVLTAKDKKTGKLYVMLTDHQRGWKMHEVMERIAEIHDQWGAVVYLESVAYQEAAFHELCRRYPEIPVHQRRPSRDKVSRFHLVKNRFEEGMLSLPQSTDPALERQLLSFPARGIHDDLVDALVWSVTGLEGTYSTPAEQFTRAIRALTGKRESDLRRQFGYEKPKEIVP